jgi:hypothetical protein
MRKMLFWGSILALSAGCGAAPAEEPSEGTGLEQEQIYPFTDWVSEEQPAGVICPGSGQAIRGAACRGSYCDDVALICAAAHSRSTTDPAIPTTPSGWTSYISEEPHDAAHPDQWNEVVCGSNQPFELDGPYVIDGIRASGAFADSISVHCAQLASGHGPIFGTCEWTPYFSEEQGTQYFPPLAERLPYTKVAIGVRCRGSYCDDMSYRVCELQ